MHSKHKSACLIVSLLLLITGCTSIYRMDSTQLKVIAVSEAMSEPAKWADVGRELQEGRDVVLHIREGQTIPIKVNMVLPMATLQPGTNSLIFTRDTYLLISRSAMRISPDGQRWANINDFKSQKTLFGFNKGDLSVGFYATEEKGTEISVDIITK